MGAAADALAERIVVGRDFVADGDGVPHSGVTLDALHVEQQRSSIAVGGLRVAGQAYAATGAAASTELACADSSTIRLTRWNQLSRAMTTANAP